MHYPFRRSSRTLIAFAAFTAIAVTTCMSATAAPVSPAPVVPPVAPVVATAPTLTAVNSPMWQTDGTVWTLAVRNGIEYAGGDFTHLRAPGVALGDTTHPATRLAAFNTSDGTPNSSFVHTADGRVQAMAISPDGKTLYIGGIFKYVDGKLHPKFAAFDLTKPGTPVLPWNPALVTGGVRAIAVSPDNTKVFIGGDFTSMGTPSFAQPRLAELNAADGTPVTSWVPAVDGPVDALLVAPNTNDVIVGGHFEHSNGAHLRALTSIDMTTGANGPIDPLITTCGTGCSTYSDIKALATDGTTIYAGAEGTGGGWFDGTLAFNPTTGHQVWYDNCLGATQAIAIVAGVLYVGSHSHDCSAIGGFGQLPLTSGTISGAVAGTKSWHHLISEQASDGKLLDWFPTTNPGPTEGVAPDELGPRAMVTDGSNLYLGGQFTKVNGVGQQGLTRFVAGATRAAPLPVTTYAASLRPGGQAVISFVGTSDPDSTALTYKIYRDKSTTPFATIGPVTSHFWDAAHYTVRDSGLTAGTHSYRVDAVDESGNTTPSAKFAASATGPGYQASVLASTPLVYWRLNEATGLVAADTSGHNYAGVYSGSLNQGVPGAIPGETGITLGNTGSVNANAPAQAAPNTYAVGVWIRTTTTTGGRIVGFGNSQSGTSSNYDRMLYMTNSGQLIYGVYTNALNYIWSPKSYNDGTWHYVVFEEDPTFGMRLYVDSVEIGFHTATKSSQAYNGWWRIGADNLSGWAQRPTSNGINADIDELAIYGAPLTVATMRAQMTSE